MIAFENGLRSAQQQKKMLNFREFQEMRVLRDSEGSGFSKLIKPKTAKADMTRSELPGGAIGQTTHKSTVSGSSHNLKEIIREVKIKPNLAKVNLS